jgi:hypothetical protein
VTRPSACAHTTTDQPHTAASPGADQRHPHAEGRPVASPSAALWAAVPTAVPSHEQPRDTGRRGPRRPCVGGRGTPTLTGRRGPAGRTTGLVLVWGGGVPHHQPRHPASRPVVRACGVPRVRARRCEATQDKKVDLVRCLKTRDYDWALYSDLMHCVLRSDVPCTNRGRQT